MLYEIHLTIPNTTNNLEQLHLNNIKIIELVLGENSIMYDVMTSDTIKVNNLLECQNYTDSLINKLKSYNTPVTRIKIESTINNPEANNALYFESHININMNIKYLDKLYSLIRPLGFCHISRNFRKKIMDNITIMLTIRDQYYEKVIERLDIVKILLDNNKIDYDKIIIESVLVDTNEEHDNIWIKK